MMGLKRWMSCACALALASTGPLVASACDTAAAPAQVIVAPQAVFAAPQALVAMPQAVVASSVFSPTVVSPFAVPTFAVGASPVVSVAPQVQVQAVSCGVGAAGFRALAAPVVVRPRVIRPVRPVVVRSRVLVF